MSTLDPELIANTKLALTKVIKKPVVTEKLLQRPPFKFIQDVILSIIKTTGFMKDLYSVEESSIDVAKDREAKITFLQKAIDALEQILGQTLDVKASKIVAGLEADKTNLFLTKLAELASSNNDSTSTPPASAATTIESTAPKTREKSPSTTINRKAVQGKKKEPSSSDQVAPKAPIKSKSGQDVKNSKIAAPVKVKKKQPVDTEEETKPSDDASANAANAVPELTVRPPTGANQRPTTARAAPPRIAKKLDADDAIAVMAAQEESIRLKSGKRIKNLIVEQDTSSQNTAQSDDQLFVVDDGTSAFDDENASYFDIKRGETNVDPNLDTQGSLIKQLTQAQTQFGNDLQGLTQSESNQSVVSYNEEKVRQNLQQLTRITNPFGRLLDALQEDVDFIFTEYRSWSDEYKRNSVLLESHLNSKDTSIDKLQSQFESLEKSIVEQLDQIATVKSSIEMKDEKLRKMISLAVSKNK